MRILTCTAGILGRWEEQNRAWKSEDEGRGPCWLPAYEGQSSAGQGTCINIYVTKTAVSTYFMHLVGKLRKKRKTKKKGGKIKKKRREN
jgi:hypothetical protein